MSLIADILAWARSELKTWQLDAMRRICEKQDLEPSDYDDLFAMLKSSRGLADPMNRQPDPLSEAHIPKIAQGNSTVRLTAIRDLDHVNRIAPGQNLEFSTKGLTVVYGPNASGKSGYSRVLKKACRARDRDETIHPNAFDPAETDETPQGIFDIEINGKASSLNWKCDEVPPEELSAISVFDSRCARTYLDDEHDVAYRPYGLDILENFGQCVIPEVQKRLDAEIAANNIETTMFDHLRGDTAVGHLVGSLCATTDCKTITDLATLTQTETRRLAELDRTLAEKDPSTKAKDLRLKAKRLEGLSSRIDTATTHVDDIVLHKLQKHDQEAIAATKAEQIAAEEFQQTGPLLPGTGNEAWKYLFEAARRFSSESAYPEKPFPYVEEDSKCVLCQQPLESDAQKRMQRFEEYVKNDTARVANEKRETCRTNRTNIKNASTSLGLDDALFQELTELDKDLPKAVLEYEQRIEGRKTWILEACVSHNWNSPPSLADDPRPRLAALRTEANNQADEHEKASNAAEKKILEDERAELQARVQLSKQKDPILDVVKRMQTHNILEECKNDLKTRPVSDEAKHLAGQSITEATEEAINKEFGELNVAHVKVKLKHSVKQGKNVQKLVLDLPITRNVRVDEILSEGEQRAIAIGSFLAELELDGNDGGIVFDDPVSSLDHCWRQNVARRLVEEAKARQVIIFTHDTAFLGELRDHIEEQNVEHLFQHLEYTYDQPGCVSEGLPWEHQSYRARIDNLEQDQRMLKANWSTYPNEDDRKKMRQVYDNLRATIERVVQDVVFNGVVQRYRDWIKVGFLSPVSCVTQTDCDEITALYAKCHKVVDAHDPSSAKGMSLPDSAQLLTDIDSLKAIINRIKSSRKLAGYT